MYYNNHKITLEYAKEKIAYWQHVVSILERCNYNKNDSIELKLFKLYARMQNVVDIAKFLKDENIKNAKTNQPYKTKEITDFIKHTSIDDKELEHFAKSLQNKNLKVNSKMT